MATDMNTAAEGSMHNELTSDCQVWRTESLLQNQQDAPWEERKSGSEGQCVCVCVCVCV